MGVEGKTLTSRCAKWATEQLQILLWHLLARISLNTFMLQKPVLALFLWMDFNQNQNQSESIRQRAIEVAMRPAVRWWTEVVLRASRARPTSPGRSKHRTAARASFARNTVRAVSVLRSTLLPSEHQQQVPATSTTFFRRGMISIHVLYKPVYWQTPAKKRLSVRSRPVRSALPEAAPDHCCRSQKISAKDFTKKVT